MSEQNADTALYEVEYAIRSGNDNYTSIVATGTCVVEATSIESAGVAGANWAHDNDPHTDPRIDPLVEIHDVRAVHGDGEV